MSGLDLYVTQGALARMFVYATVTGFLVGGVYDVLRVLRAFWDNQDSKRGRRMSLYGRILLFFEDVFFVIVTFVAFVLLCYYTNDGQLRAPAFVGMACGFFVYRYTIGCLTRRLTRPFVRCVRILSGFLLAPIRILLKWIGGIVTKVLNELHRRRKEARAARQNRKEMLSQVDSVPENHVSSV